MDVVEGGAANTTLVPDDGRPGAAVDFVGVVPIPVPCGTARECLVLHGGGHVLPVARAHVHAGRAPWDALRHRGHAGRRHLDHGDDPVDGGGCSSRARCRRALHGGHVPVDDHHRRTPRVRILHSLRHLLGVDGPLHKLPHHVRGRQP